MPALPPAQIRKPRASIEQCDFVVPIVIDAATRVIAGWGLALAAKKLGLREAPAVTITGLDGAIGPAGPLQCNGREGTDCDNRHGEAVLRLAPRVLAPAAMIARQRQPLLRLRCGPQLQCDLSLEHVPKKLLDFFDI